jgi:tRNA(His) 5'-end guanylyltransferase
MSMGALDDRMKMYEAVSTSGKAFKGQPLIARLDGKAFHTFTKGLKRPYDERLSNLMVATTRHLVDQYGARVGYTQSDEITLVWFHEIFDAADYPFGGRFQKLDSLLASAATAYFNSVLPQHLPEKVGRLAMFDCRSFVVPTPLEAYNCVVWRQQDAMKNAISMAAHSMFSHNSLIGMSSQMMQERMWKEKGVNFNDYPFFFKRGTFVRRVKEARLLTAERLATIPEQYRPTKPVERSFIDTLDIWLTKQPNGVDALLYGAKIVNPDEPAIPENADLEDSFGSSHMIKLSQELAGDGNS